MHGSWYEVGALDGWDNFAEKERDEMESEEAQSRYTHMHQITKSMRYLLNLWPDKRVYKQLIDDLCLSLHSRDLQRWTTSDQRPWSLCCTWLGNT